MRLLLAQLAPVPGDLDRNLERLRAAVRAAPCDLAVFPELFLSGYRVGDRMHRLALRADDRSVRALREVAHASGATVVVGAPVASRERPGEVHNAALAVPPSGDLLTQVKRYLPTFGPFEEGVPFTPTERSAPVALPGATVGLEVCYDVFFPEVSRQLALGGAELIVAISAAPVTSRRLFDRLLPARAIENAVPVVYVNRVGVEDGIVFGGGSGGWDPRGEPIASTPVPFAPAAPEESLALLEVDPHEAMHWRPFRPVLRDVAGRSGSAEAMPPAERAPSDPRSIPTRAL
ncbi:MAG TPA: carbon-nitrogen hydrolase family protein [Thermoplasmata archaeon]|jgi:predicted amidohydrolase|nr:carbon-nitrogen hydrolase family protein [Thermoplasmata archaeon]